METSNVGLILVEGWCANFKLCPRRPKSFQEKTYNTKRHLKVSIGVKGLMDTTVYWEVAQVCWPF